MNTVEIQKPNATQLAYNDLGSTFNLWNENAWKPGEKRIIRYYADLLASNTKEIQQNEKQLSILNAAYKNAVHFGIEGDDKKQVEEQLKVQILQLEQELCALEADKDNILEAINRIYFNHPEWRTDVADSAKSQPKQRSRSAVFFRTVIPGLILFAFCSFDGLNMFFRLQNFRNDTILHGILCSIIFLAVLFTSFSIKRRNSLVYWAGFLLFLSLANVAQFLGKSPKIGLSNLLDSPERILIFILSFFGSIVITLIYKKLSHEEEVDRAGVKKVEMSLEEKRDRDHLNRLEKRLTDTEGSSRITGGKISTLKNKCEELRKDCVQEKNLKEEEKLDAIRKLDSKREEVKEQIEGLKVEAKDLPDECRQSIQEYRQEIELQRLISKHPKAIKFADINSINL